MTTTTTPHTHQARRSVGIVRTLACSRRVLQQLSHDHRSMAIIVLMPSVLLLVFRYVYDDTPMIFDRIGPQMLGLFPFIIMFLVTSVTMVRERTSGTLERLLTTPLRRGELIGGYALAFGLAALCSRWSARPSRSGCSGSMSRSLGPSGCSPWSTRCWARRWVC
jgi:ABC-2 type transporter